MMVQAKRQFSSPSWSSSSLVPAKFGNKGTTSSLIVDADNFFEEASLLNHRFCDSKRPVSFPCWASWLSTSSLSCPSRTLYRSFVCFLFVQSFVQLFFSFFLNNKILTVGASPAIFMFKKCPNGLLMSQ
jgi:hypothetical protein